MKAWDAIRIIEQSSTSPAETWAQALSCGGFTRAEAVKRRCCLPPFVFSYISIYPSIYIYPPIWLDAYNNMDAYIYIYICNTFCYLCLSMYLSIINPYGSKHCLRRYKNPPDHSKLYSKHFLLEGMTGSIGYLCTVDGGNPAPPTGWLKHVETLSIMG